jgi:hypothetical protein
MKKLARFQQTGVGVALNTEPHNRTYATSASLLLANCGKSLIGQESMPQGLKPTMITLLLRRG